MFVLMIIGIILLIIAIVNWGQSEGFFHKMRRLFGHNSSLDESTHRYAAGAGGVGMVDGENLEERTYAEDSDYFDYREDE